MDDNHDLAKLMPNLDANTRRKFLKKGLMLGLSGTALATFLAACGATATPAAPAQPSPTLPGIPTAAVAQATTAPAAAATTAPASAATTAAGAATTAPAAAATTAASAGTPKRGGTITWVGHQDIGGLGPDDWGPTVQFVMIMQIHNALLELDENYVLQPTLAESFEVTKDGLSYTFKLRKGVKFHDGTEFTSADVKYTYEFYGSPANAAANSGLFNSISAIETPDKNTVVIKLKQPNAAFLVNTATFFIVPAEYHKKIGEKEYKFKPMGTGAFKLKEVKPAETVLVEANNDHFRGRPNLDAVREDIVPEASVRAIALQTGKADSATWGLLVEDSFKLAKDTNFITYRTSEQSVTHFGLNNQSPKFKDKVVRQAMMYAINRQRLIDDIWKGAAILATSNLSPALGSWYEKEVKQYPFDQAKAKQMLDDAGWKAGSDGIRAKDGVKLSFNVVAVAGDTARRPLIEVSQQDLKQVGIELTISEQPVPAIQKGQRDGTIDSSLYNWTYGGAGGEPDATSTLRSDSNSNWNLYKNPKMDELLDNGLKETDPAKRKQIYSEIQKLVAEEVPFIYIMNRDAYTQFTKRVKGLPKTALNSDGVYKKAYTYWIE